MLCRLASYQSNEHMHNTGTESGWKHTHTALIQHPMCWGQMDTYMDSWSIITELAWPGCVWTSENTLYNIVWELSQAEVDTLIQPQQDNNDGYSCITATPMKHLNWVATERPRPVDHLLTTAVTDLQLHSMAQPVTVTKRNMPAQTQ